MQTYIHRVEAALHDLQHHKMVILCDDPERENEGDLIFPAEFTHAAWINFMIKYCSGIICLSLTEEKLAHLALPLMVSPQQNTSHRGTPFTVSIEAKHGVTTGVSAADRAHTILTVMQKDVKASDLVRPGHIYPLQAKPGGVLERAGHTEGAIDLMRLAGLQPAAVLCEVMNADGTMAKGAELAAFAKAHEIRILAMADLIAYRRYRENLIAEQMTAHLPLAQYGEFEMTVVREKITGLEHIVLTKKTLTTKPLLVRVHSTCMTGDLFGSQRCDCQQQLHYALQRIAAEGGMLIYLNQEGRGIGLFNKIKAYALQEQGLDTIEANHSLQLPADSREYYIAANILRNANISKIRLLTSNPHKINQLLKYGMAEVQAENMPVFCNEYNKNYLVTKKNKLQHFLNSELLVAGEA